MSQTDHQLNSLELAREKLSLRQQRFCEEYVVHFVGAKAARVAGFSEKTAGQQSYTMLKENENVKDYINQLVVAQSRRTEVDSDKVVQELAKIGFSNIKSFYDNDGKLRTVNDLDGVQSAAINSMKETTFKDSEGASRVVREYKLHDKLGALRELGSHLGIYDKDKTKDISKVELSVTINKGKRKK